MKSSNYLQLLPTIKKLKELYTYFLIDVTRIRKGRTKNPIFAHTLYYDSTNTALSLY